MYVTHQDGLERALIAVRRAWRAKTAGDNAAQEPSAPDGKEDDVPTAPGAGYQDDTETRRAVELRAVEIAEAIYRDAGYAIARVGKPYDLKCTHSSSREERRVEVKGRQDNEPTTVIVTSGEVKHTREARCAVDLLVVAGIRVSSPEGQRVATGGTIYCHVRDWSPADEDLAATQYQYRLR